MSTIQNNIRDALAASGFRFTGGRWLRLKGKDLDSISINSESGGFRDHRTGEHGGWSALCSRLGIDGSGFIPAVGDRRENDEQQDERSRQWAKTQWARAVPAVAPKRPSGWSLESWEQEQAPWADMREAVFDYLLSRGLDPALFLPLIRIANLDPRTDKYGEPNMDMQMQEAGADFAFLIPMYEIRKPQIPENICGLQRTYIAFGQDKYSKARKIGRAMLGKKGVTELPQANLQPVILPYTDGPILGAGEGFETVASFVQVMRRPAVVCWDWSGLKAWSESVTPTENAPLVALLVDNDKSQTGQRESAAAVARITAQEHGKAVYLLPEGIEADSKGNIDWNDALRQKGAEAFAADIIHAWYKSEENLALAPNAPIKKDLMQDAEIPQTVAAAVDRVVAYAQAESAAREYLAAWRRYQADLAAWKESDPATRGKRPKLPPMLLKITTGVGKSHLVRELLSNPEYRDVAFLILARTHELARPYLEAIAGSGAYEGRVPPAFEPLCQSAGYTMADLEQNAFVGSTCFKYPVVALVAEHNHAPSLTACRSCEHGRKYMIENYHPSSQPYIDAWQWLRENGFTDDKIRDIAPCKWLEMQDRMRRTRIVVAPNAGFSDALASWQVDEGDPIPRLVIVDEIPELTRHLAVTTADLGIHTRKARELAERLQKEIHDAGDPERTEELEKNRVDLLKAVTFLSKVAQELGGSVKDGEMITLPDELLQEAKDLHVDWLPGATARWEKAELRYGKEAFVPLRVMKAILDSATTRTTKVVDGVLHCHEMTNLGTWLSRGKPCMLLDATPSQAVERIVTRKDGRIISAVAEQHVHLVHYNQYLHGRSWKNKKHQYEELSSLLLLKEQMMAETGSTPVVLTYMPHTELADTKENPDWGHFGKDDIGQDGWKGRDMLVFGGNIFSPTTQAMVYDSELMLSRLAGDDSMPDWNPETAREQEIVVGSKVDMSKAPLPVDPVLREWILADYARRMAQAIGRSRAVWATPDQPIRIWIAGGLPLAGLAAHGIEIAEFRQEKVNMNDKSREATEQKVFAAIAALQAADRDPAYRAVQKQLQKMGLPGVRYAAWERIKDSVYGPDNIPIKGVDGLLAALHNVETVAFVGECALLDAARSIFQHPLSSPTARLASALVYEASPGGGGGGLVRI